MIKGISFTGALTLILITLKLTGHIDWNWVWVLCPLWLAPASIMVFFIAMLLVAVLSTSESGTDVKARRKD